MTSTNLCDVHLSKVETNMTANRLATVHSSLTLQVFVCHQHQRHRVGKWFYCYLTDNVVRTPIAVSHFFMRYNHHSTPT